MNERTDFGWFLHGADLPAPHLINVSFSSGVFHATTGTNPNLFLLDTGNPFAARLGKTGTNHPIDAAFYKLVAIHMYVNGGPQALFGWNRNDLWDGSQSLSNVVTLSAGWRLYLIDIPSLGISSGPTPWSGQIRSLYFYPSYLNQYDLYIDWIRLVNIDVSLCRQVTWSGFTGAVNLYLDPDAATNGNETMLASGVASNSASKGCSPTGSGHNFYAGALAPGSYHVLARAVGSTGAYTRSSGVYIVNAAPTLTITSPSEEGSAEDFATTKLGNPWDMDVLSDIDRLDQVTGAQITTIQAETPAGVALPNTRVFWGTSVAHAPPAGDPQLGLLWEGGANAGASIDPARYRILTVEFGMPNTARSINRGSVARIVWRVAGSTLECVSDDIIFNSRVGANVLDKFSVDMADRSMLPLEKGAGLSQLGWVPGSLGGIDRFRFDPHEFPNGMPFFVRRIKLAALEKVGSGSTYTFRWTASEGSGTVTLYYDTDRNPLNGRTLIGSAATSAGAFKWTVPGMAAGQYYIQAEINDGQNVNSVYSSFPMVLGGAQPPSAPPNPRIVF